MGVIARSESDVAIQYVIIGFLNMRQVSSAVSAPLEGEVTGGRRGVWFEGFRDSSPPNSCRALNDSSLVKRQANAAVTVGCGKSLIYRI